MYEKQKTNLTNFLKQKVKSIRIYSNLIVYKEEGKENLKEKEQFSVDINKNNIKKIKRVHLYQKERHSSSNYFNIGKFFEVQFNEEVDYEKIYGYVNEIIVYIQFYCPKNFEIKKLELLIG